MAPHLPSCRGFGDHDLRAQDHTGPVLIKPFLTPQPEVRVLDVETEAVTAEDVLVLATDGLWDVVSNEEVAAVVQRGLQAWDNESKAGKYRYISLAQVTARTGFTILNAPQFCQ